MWSDLAQELQVRENYKTLTEFLIANNITITTMESATSGQIASLITDTQWASAIMKWAFVTYSNEAKIKQWVPSECIEKFWVYSTQTADAMAKACRETYQADIGIWITGSFGNVDPNNKDSVPGKVYFSIQTKDKMYSYQIELPTNISRHQSKIEVAQKIYEKLFEILGIN
jgi:PncC family amidohydrolase